MQPQIKLSIATQQLLRCPICKAKLSRLGEQFRCSNCGTLFPIIDGIPVLLNENSSVFSIDDLVHWRKSRESKIEKMLKRLIPKIGSNIKAKSNYDKFAKLLLGQSDTPRVLVVGGRILGKGMKSLLKSPSIKLVESDVSFGPRTMLICDAHDIPFENDSFDGVIRASSS